MTGFTRLARFITVILAFTMAGFDVSVQSIQEAEPCLLSGPYNNPGVLDLARPRDTMPMPCLF